MKLYSAGLKWALIFFTVLFLFGYILYPITNLVFASDFDAAIITEQTLLAAFNSLTLSFLSVIGSCIIGVCFAYIFYCRKLLFRRVLSTVILLPIATPPIIGVMSYLFLLGDGGVVMKLMNLNKMVFTGWGAILTIHIYSFYPLFYLFVSNGLQKIDYNTIEASNVLGASRLKTFYTIILPQVKNSIVSASLLTFMASMASFSAPFIFGGSHRFLTTEIYYAKINGDASYSSMLSLVLIFISLTILFFVRRISNNVTPSKNKGSGKYLCLNTGKKYDLFSTVVSLIFCAVIILPFAVLILISVMPNSSIMDDGLDYHLSLSNYYTLFADYSLLKPLLNSIFLSSIGLLMAVVIGLSVSQLMSGKQNLFKNILEITASIPYGIPGSVIALCLILSFNKPRLISLNTVLVGTFWILPIAYAIRNLPIMTQSIKVGFQTVDLSIKEASYSLGATKFRSWSSITLPLIYPFIVEGSLLVFINSFGEFVSTILLYNFSTRTMPIEIYSQLRLYNNGMAATYGLIIFLIIIMIIGVTRRLVKK